MNIRFVVVIVVAAALFLLRGFLMRRRAEAINETDPGSAILTFGLAFPDEAIRAAVHTADGDCTFLRLADGKTGFVREKDRRDVARVIEPGTIRMAGSGDSHALEVAFDGSESGSETFMFSTPEDAAEVALWLFGSFADARGGQVEGDK